MKGSFSGFLFWVNPQDIEKKRKKKGTPGGGKYSPLRQKGMIHLHPPKKGGEYQLSTTDAREGGSNKRGISYPNNKKRPNLRIKGERILSHARSAKREGKTHKIIRV